MIRSLRWLWRKVAGARNYSLFELALVPFAWLLLGVSRLAILAVPFKQYRRILGKESDLEASVTEVSERHLKRAKSIGRVVRATANLTPWGSVCLPQAITASVLIRLNAIPATTYFGLAKGEQNQPDDPMKAHAWVQVGDLTITGGPVDPSYRAVAAFQLGQAQ